MYERVHVFRYVTKGTFDAYNWSIIENKQKFISQVMTDGLVDRSCTDIDEAVLNYAEMKAIASGNPLIKQKMEVDSEVAKLNLLKKNFLSGKYKLEKEYKEILPQRKSKYERYISCIKADIMKRDESPVFHGKSFGFKAGDNNAEVEKEDSADFSIMLHNREIKERKKAGELLSDIFRSMDGAKEVECGNYAGFDIFLKKDMNWHKKIILKGYMMYTIEVDEGSDIGLIYKIQNAVRGFEKLLRQYEQNLEDIEAALITTKQELDKKFPKEDELQKLLKQQCELNELLAVSDEPDQSEEIAENVGRKNIKIS